MVTPSRIFYRADFTVYLSLITAAMERLRATPPTSLGGLDVEQVDDLALGSADLPPTDGLRFRLQDDARVVVRPSGTEPKLKCYLQVVEQVGELPLAQAKQRAADRLEELTQAVTALVEE